MELSSVYSMRSLCEALGINRSTVYYQPQMDEYELRLRDKIEQIAAKYPRYGYRRTSEMLKRDGYQVGYRRVARIMKEENLQVHVKRYCRTTHSTGGMVRYPNLLKDSEIEHLDQFWCGDITYVRLKKEFIYLAVLMDIFSRSIRGWHLSRSLNDELTLGALEMALGKGKPEIHHSDHGMQYLSGAYVRRLDDLGVSISLASRGAAWENGYAERLIRTLKEEEVYLHEYEDFHDAFGHIGYFLDEVYMRKRPHSSLGYRTPAEFEVGSRGKMLLK
jgi:transposase InsO family protein